MGIHSVTAILVRPLFGRVLDKRGGRIVAIVGMLVMIASMPGFYLLQSAGLLAVLLRALNGVGWGVATTALLAICSDLVPPATRVSLATARVASTRAASATRVIRAAASSVPAA